MTRIGRLVQQFSDNVAAQTDAIRRGDARTGNRHAKRYIRAFHALRELGDEGRDALVPLMREGRDDVRAMAAAFLLRHRPVDAHAVLHEIAGGKGFVAFEAQEALKRWEEGSWQLDPA
jgi:hypothetical protein